MSEYSLWDHQKRALEKSKSASNLALFMDAGTGKTFTAIEILRTIYNESRRIKRTLIFAPPIVLKQWKSEFKKFSRIPQDKIHILYGEGRKRVELFNSTKYEGGLYITNYESLQMDKLYSEFISWRPEILICDEAHRIKNPTAVRTKKMIRLSDTMHDPRRLILTGTPILNSMMDLFSQYRVLFGQQSPFGTNFYAFRNTYFYDKNAGMPSHIHFPDFVIRKDAEARIQEIIKATSVTAKKSECLDLPPIVKKKVEVELSPLQKKLYKELLDDFIAFVSDESAIVANTALTKALRLQQLVAGVLAPEGAEHSALEKTPRLDALSDLLEDIAPFEKVIVWTNFKPSYQAIAKVCDDLKLKYVFLTGEQTHKEKAQSVEAITKDKDVRVVIGNPQAAGLGVNLVECSSMIYFSRNFSLENELQSEARNYRGGSEMHDKITRYDIVAPGTIDEVIMEALASKEDLAGKIFEIKKRLL